MMIGLPGSGKSYTAKSISEYYDYEIFSSDKIREEIFGDEFVQGDNSIVFSTLHERISSALMDGKDSIYDATNLSQKKRMAFLNYLKSKKIVCHKTAVLIWRPFEECLEANNKRNRVVPECVMNKMYGEFHTPMEFEGWDSVRIIYNTQRHAVDLVELVNSLKGFSQDNPNHALTLGKHMEQAFSYAKKGGYPLEVQLAAFFHDIGKEKTKTFYDCRGNLGEIAHYYRHENISAYDIFDLRLEDTGKMFLVSSLICNHMIPYSGISEKKMESLKNMWGLNYYNMLMQLHKCDTNAH